MRIILSRLRVRLRALLRRKAVERELDEEVRYHLDRLIAEGLAAGMSADAARAAALRSFAGVEQAKEECRDARGTRLLDDLLHDLRYAARGLRRSPGFAVTVVLCLAVGIGANVTIFSLYNGALLRPMPVTVSGTARALCRRVQRRHRDGREAATGPRGVVLLPAVPTAPRWTDRERAAPGPRRSAKRQHHLAGAAGGGRRRPL